MSKYLVSYTFTFQNGTTWGFGDQVFTLPGECLSEAIVAQIREAIKQNQPKGCTDIVLLNLVKLED